MTRIYECQMDALFARALTSNAAFAKAFLSIVDGRPDIKIESLATQTLHRATGHRGSIDLEVSRADGSVLLIENKIDAGFSVTTAGDPQPERYRASVAELLDKGQPAASILLAPEIYLRGNRHADTFDHHVSYEALRGAFLGADLALLDAAIDQASTPYNPDPNPSSGDFFANFEAFAREYFPELIIKRNPNGKGVRPTGSRTIYFDVRRTLRTWEQLPRPRMSLQCRDGAAPSASVKIMLGGMAAQAVRLATPDQLRTIGGYIRPAGRSLGFVIDTPQLDTQKYFYAQVTAVEESLEASRRLAAWWNDNAGTLQF